MDEEKDEGGTKTKKSRKKRSGRQNEGKWKGRGDLREANEEKTKIRRNRNEEGKGEIFKINKKT